MGTNIDTSGTGNGEFWVEQDFFVIQSGDHIWPIKLSFSSWLHPAQLYRKSFHILRFIAKAFRHFVKSMHVEVAFVVVFVSVCVLFCFMKLSLGRMVMFLFLIIRLADRTHVRT